MRPRIIHFLNHYFHTAVFGWVIPGPAVVYAVMLTAGIMVFLKRCRTDNLDRYHATGMVIWGSIAALLGARLFYLIQNADLVIKDPGLLFQINGATVSFGVYIGGVLGIFFYSRKNELKMLPYLDILASVLGLGPLIGRMACFLNGDDFGTLSNVPWAVKFPHGSQPFIDQVNKQLITPMSDLSLAVHPTQLYGCLNGLLLFVIFSSLWRKKKFPPGVLFFLFWIAYGILRFMLEYFRGDDDRGWVGPLSTGQFMSILFIVLSIFSLTVLNQKYRRNALITSPPPLA